MGQRILDTNVLISFWWKCWNERSRDERTAKGVRNWARDLIKARNSNSVVSPVVVEFIAGSKNNKDLLLLRAFIEEFDIVDAGVIPREDWQAAKLRAERIPRNGKRRDLGDCLILAIADRLHMDVDSLDEGLNRSRTKLRLPKRRRR